MFYCIPYKIHIKGLELCFSFNFSSLFFLTFGLKPSPLFPVLPAHVHNS